MIHKEGLVLKEENAWENMTSHIKKKEYSKVFIVVDKNTEIYCLPYFYKKINLELKWEILSIPCGENHKNIITCIEVWEELANKKADRNSLIINLGGGMVTDLGGFIASSFKRGVDFINIPTTLLAMVDASIGGKNGIDFGRAKNQIGTINLPEMVVIENSFLNTLPQRQLVSGLAEMLKHGLIHSSASWEKINLLDHSNQSQFKELIWESIEIKSEIVRCDPLELNLRKTLNYGHTLGHAIESHFLEQTDTEPLLHGEAVAIGLMLATYISNQLLGFPGKKLMEVSAKIASLFPKQTFSEKDINNILSLLVFDKKNRNGQVLFVLLHDIGKPKTDCIVDNNLIHKAFEYYKNF